jgi:Domain of unknown function (DUF1887)
MAIDLLTQCDQLIESISLVYSDRKSSLPAKAQEKFSKVIDQLQLAKTKLEDINENVMQLTALNTEAQNLADARSIWKSMPSGLIRGEPLKELVNKSSLALKFLREGYIDVVELGKFSDSEMKLAQQLGPNFPAFEAVWADWRYNIFSNPDNHFLWLRERGETVLDDAEQIVAVKPNKFFPKFAKLLEPIYGSYLSKELQGCNRNGRQKSAENSDWSPLTWESYEKESWKTNRQVRLLLGKPTNNEFLNFVKGGWFEAYVQYQFSDMLDRLNVPHEVFTRLKYKTTLNQDTEGVDVRREGGHFAGEIDVVVSTHEKILFVECKSGKFNMEDAQKVVRRKNVINAALKSTNATSMQVEFLLVHAPRIESDDVIKYVTDYGVTVLNPGDVYQFAKMHFQSTQ